MRSGEPHKKSKKKRGWSPKRALSLLLFCSLPTLLNCGPIEEAVPLDEEGEPIAIPEPGEEWLRIVEVTPQEITETREEIFIYFDQYLNPRTFRSFGLVQLSSGGWRRSGQVEYYMTRKAIGFRPNNNYEPEFRYQLVFIGGEELRSATGSPLWPQTVLGELKTGESLQQSRLVSRRPSVPWSEVEEIFEAHCQVCHGDESWRLPDLLATDLTEVRSQQVDGFLIEPFAPGRSYLMAKILPDYPNRRFTVQPPPWSDAAPLTIEQVEKIEHWIANGARQE